MSQENVEAHMRAFEAANRQDIGAILEGLDPEVEWHPAMQALPGGEATVYRGHEGIREMFRDFYDAFSEIHVDLSEFRDHGDRTVAIGRLRTRGKESGALTESPWASVVEYEHGQGDPGPNLPRSEGGPRSRRAAGAGDVGERGRQRLISLSFLGWVPGVPPVGV